MGTMAVGLHAFGEQPSELPTGVYRIPIQTPLAVGEVNAYVLTGEAPTLVDVGPGTPEALETLQDGLRTIGLRLEDIWQVVITHPHVDHAGLAKTVAEISGARVLAHQQSARWLSDPCASTHNTIRFLREWGERQGIPDDVLVQLSWDFIRWGGLAKPVSVDEVLQDGESVMAGNDIWRILHTPGHSSGHLCLFREVDGTLISGDHLLPGSVSSTLLEPARPSGTDRVRAGLRYLASLSQLALLGLGAVLPGHGHPFCGVTPEFVVKRIAAVRRRAEQVFHLLEEQPLTIWELCGLIFPRVTPEMMIFALSNVVGYLDLLSANGQIAQRHDGEVTRFVALGASVDIAV